MLSELICEKKICTLNTFQEFKVATHIPILYAFNVPPHYVTFSIISKAIQYQSLCCVYLWTQTFSNWRITSVQQRPVTWLVLFFCCSSIFCFGMLPALSQLSAYPCVFQIILFTLWDLNNLSSSKACNLLILYYTVYHGITYSSILLQVPHEYSDQLPRILSFWGGQSIFPSWTLLLPIILLA